MRHNLHMQLPMTQVIAVRGFHWVDDPEHQLLVSIGKPEETPDGGGEFYQVAEKLLPIHNLVW